jgi:arginyl-tRNA synthetase
MKKFQEIIAALAAAAAGGDPAENHALISAPPRPEMGDYTLPCFSLSKKLRKDPKKIAAELASKVKLAGTPFASVEAAGPYVNFRLDDVELAREALTSIHEEGGRFGGSDAGQGRTVLIDYSSPNIAKPFHIGHLRSTVIGAALYRIYGALGYKPVGINHLGDWGTQFGMVMAAFQEHGDAAALAADPIGYSLKLYVEFNQRCEKDEAARELAKQWFKRLEDGDPAARELWEKFRGLSLGKFEKIYRRLGVGFDHYTGESFYNDQMEAALLRVREAGVLARSDDGAEMIRLEEFGMPPFILKKSDGATLYATREIAAVLYRFETFRPEKILYVVGTPQELHFRQLRQSLVLMDRRDLAERIVHVKFGHVQGMSTRRGEVVLLEDVLEEARQKARDKVEENVAAGKLDPADDRAALSEAVGIGALIANDLKHRRERDIVFDWDQAMQFDGETGPYLQYAYARIMGIMRKAGGAATASVDFALLSEPETRALIRALADFPETVEKAAADNEPSYITTCLFELTKAFNVFYISHRVLGAGAGKEAARLSLVAACGQVIRNGLGLLGIPVLERM